MTLHDAENLAKAYEAAFYAVNGYSCEVKVKVFANITFTVEDFHNPIEERELSQLIKVLLRLTNHLAMGAAK